jgi:abortive infection bacteriophage resistance protein
LIGDRDKAEYYLSHLNYYRLAAYCLPFEKDHNTHQYIEGTSFEQVLTLYIFDRELRLLVLDTIERVEVSIRTHFSYTFANKYGPHKYLNPALFKTKWPHARNVKQLEDQIRSSREVFIRHLAQKYDEPLPPIWATVEIMTFGQLSKWYANLSTSADRNAIANVYGMDEINLVSFLHHLSTVRNICAHHSRLWNREFTFTFKLPKKRPKQLLQVLNFSPSTSKRIYNTLVMLDYLMVIISPDTHRKNRLLELLSEHPVADPSSMGFPEGWKKLPIAGAIGR